MSFLWLLAQSQYHYVIGCVSKTVNRSLFEFTRSCAEFTRLYDETVRIASDWTTRLFQYAVPGKLKGNIFTGVISMQSLPGLSLSTGTFSGCICRAWCRGN